MINIDKYRQAHQKAYELMKAGDLLESGKVFQSLYAQLRMNSYRQRLPRRKFEKVFYGLTPGDVLLLLYNKTAWHMNACETKHALDSIKTYQAIERDFSINGAPDFEMSMNEIEVHRRLGDNKQALRCCERLLKTKLDTPNKVDVLIAKGSIETSESHNIFGINSLSLALAEAEACGDANLIAYCYMEMAKMIGLHYPSLGLSFLWKSRVFYEAIGEKDRLAYCKMRMAMAFFLLWHKTKESCFMEEAVRLVNDDIQKEDFCHPAGGYTLDRLKGAINKDVRLLEESLEAFESIQAYGEVLTTAEFLIKTCLSLGDREGAKKGAMRYEQAALVLKDQERLDYIRSFDLDRAEASWVMPMAKKDLPDLLDVLDSIAFDEEKFHLSKEPSRPLFPTHYQEGMFDAVQMSDGKARLYPCALYPGRYFRGQSDKLDGKQCKPSLFRDLTAAEMFHERLCLKELEILISYYPLTKVFEGMFKYHTPEGDTKPLCLNVDVTALGQHYGIKTDVLDLTADKWVAAFFAATVCKDGVYSPYKGDGEGVMYIFEHVPAADHKSERLSAVGLQPFSRPGCQAGLVYRMEPNEDFNKKARRIIFKHDPAISELIFNYCNRSKKLFPDEILEEKVKAIHRSERYSSVAYTMTINEYYPDVPGNVIESYMRDLHISALRSEPAVYFTKEEMVAFLDKWNREKHHFFDSIITRLTYTDAEMPN